VIDSDSVTRPSSLAWDDYELNASPCKAYTVSLAKGQLYQFDLKSDAFDALLRLEDAHGRLLYLNDNGGGATNSRIVCQIEETGVYRLIVTSVVPRIGSFQLTVRTRSVQMTATPE